MQFGPSIFQIPIPTIFFLVPPSHPIQWLLRLSFLFYTITIALPLIFHLVPLSLILSKVLSRPVGLSIHPDNAPPRVSFSEATKRGWMVYTVGTVIWAITSLGNAPETSDKAGRRIARVCCWFVKLFTAVGSPSRLVHREEEAEPIEDKYRIAAMKQGSTRRMTVFSISREFNTPAPAPGTLGKEVDGAQEGFRCMDENRQETSTSGKAILFLAGGGYVTGTPLSHPFVFSLARRLPAPGKGGYRIFAPCVRKSLDKKRSFPTPLLDALAAYAHVRRTYPAVDITIMGDSAGGGLCWSLAAYLAVLDTVSKEELGLPGGVILISVSQAASSAHDSNWPLVPAGIQALSRPDDCKQSSGTDIQPWLALPPAQDSSYPDFVDVPQLLNAARCYMARYPILPHRPDPFSSDLLIWSAALRQYLRTVLTKLPLSHFVYSTHRPPSSVPTRSADTPGIPFPLNKSSSPHEWLEIPILHKLSSHHPLVSPSSDPSSPFVRNVLRAFAQNGTRILLHVGTAEWFYLPSIQFAVAAQNAGVDLRLHEEKGGQHSEACVLPAEMGGRAQRLVEGVLDWLGERPGQDCSSR